MYKITIKKTANKELESLPNKIAAKIAQVVYSLSNDPRPQGCKKLKGTYEPLWRIRIGDYRVIYIIDDAIKIVDIQKVGHRKDIYD